MDRYHGAVYRFALAVLGEPEAAQELFQGFAHRFLRGDFRGVDPTKGRFRDSVVVRHGMTGFVVAGVQQHRQ
jgi:hypothetical protein